MRLYRKTILFFIGVIAFQSILTILLITYLTSRANLADAQKGLEDESAVLYEGLNAWKRQLWISLITITNDRQFPRQFVRDRERSLRELLLLSKADAVAVKDPRGVGITTLSQTSPGVFTLADVQGLTRGRDHPYIELVSIRGSLCLLGASALSWPGGRPDVFLLKRLDNEFCSQLTLNRNSLVALLRGAQVLASTLPPGAAVGFDPRGMRTFDVQLYDRPLGGGRYNATFLRLGRLDPSADGEELFLATFVSNEPFNQKLLELDRAILLVSVAAALLTMLMGLFFSRNITHPIGELLGAMGRIRDGALDTQVQAPGGYEIGRLFDGFNDMARELAASRAASHSALQETVLLKEYNENIVNSIRAGIAIVNSDLVLEKANHSFLSTFGLEASRAVGAPLTYLDIDVIDEIIVERIFAIFRRETRYHQQVSRSRAGRVYEIRLYPFYSVEGEFHEGSGCVLMVDDISARTELEEKIFQAEKLSTISMLSAGMAHEINNPLGSILTNVQNLMDEESHPDRRVSLKWIEQETRRIARVVQELLNFASADSAHAPGSDVNEVVTEVAGLMRRSLGRDPGIRIEERLAPGLPPSAVSTDELKQVVINLLRNSIQAISGEGRIVVLTRAASAGGIELAVADTGSGIPREIVPRIFDPFFTTKRNREGTGLGLSVVYGIVNKHHGSIDVRSREGRGACICLRLPAMAATGRGAA
ncbi:MAG TPA: ATP-binding protein [Spirochaetia bacterium]|nr:ATP-binding protein [Spirochaetia bacterium]